MTGPFRWLFLFNGEAWAKTKVAEDTDPTIPRRYGDLPVRAILAAQAIAGEGDFILKPSRRGELPPIPLLHEMPEVFRRNYEGRFVSLTDNLDNPGDATWRLPRPDDYFPPHYTSELARQTGIPNPSPNAVCHALLDRYKKEPDELLAAAALALQLQQKDLWRYDTINDVEEFLKAREQRRGRIEEDFGPYFNPNLNEVTFLREAVMQVANSLRLYADQYGAHFQGKFKLGHCYRTLGGHDVTIVQEQRNLPGYECVGGDDGIWRYDRPSDYGRCTGSSNDADGNPDQRNLVIPDEL